MISLLHQSIKVELLWLSKIFSFQLTVVDNSFSFSFLVFNPFHDPILINIIKTFKNAEIHLKATGGGEEKFVVSLSPLKETFSGQWELFAGNFDNFHLFTIKEKYI